MPPAESTGFITRLGLDTVAVECDPAGATLCNKSDEGGLTSFRVCGTAYEIRLAPDDSILQLVMDIPHSMKGRQAA